MLKSLSLISLITLLSACSMSSYVPFMNDKKAVIDLDKTQIDRKNLMQQPMKRRLLPIKDE